jgi:hypothetical protein
MYGTPQAIVTDNVSVFRCKQVKQMCFKWAITHITTTPYYPQGSLVERANRNLKSALKVFHHQSQNRWDEDLPWISAAFNTAVHESSKFTPDILFLGREIKSPLITHLHGMEVHVGIKILPYILSRTAHSISEFKYPRDCKRNVEMFFTSHSTHFSVQENL